MGRRHKPSRWPVNWTVVSIAAVLTLIIGIGIAFLSSADKRSGIVVPQPSTPPPALVKPSGFTAELDPTVSVTILPRR
nr:hypothetical protein [Kibdelosporangium sp. MJ126-NF4]CEL19559.1 hypothetical protein [Kibdelosporangium sp. MJ126-NF4]CTQ94641.1 hypothetical protein [Kibdelosporangium sp. MJ126-NF4]